MTLKELLASKPTTVDDCMGIIDAEVADKSGISGLAIKAGFAAVKGVKPGFIRGTVVDLIPQFADALEPMWIEAKSKGGAPGDYFLQNKSKVANALLAITDAKAKTSP